MGTLLIPPRFSRKLKSCDPGQIAKLRTQGLSWREIGRALRISPRSAQRIAQGRCATPNAGQLEEVHEKELLCSNSGTYFLESAGLVKIGYSGDVRTRVSVIRCCCPTDVKVLWVLRGNTETEWQAQKKFAHLHVHGEWFRLTDEIIDFIRRDQNGEPLDLPEVPKMDTRVKVPGLRGVQMELP